MAGPGRELPVAHVSQNPTERRLIQRDREFVKNPHDQIAQTPAHHAIKIWCRAGLNDMGKGSPLLGIQSWGRARRLAIDQAVRTFCVETQNPIADRLKTDIGKTGCVGTRPAIVDQRKGQKPSCLFCCIRQTR